MSNQQVQIHKKDNTIAATLRDRAKELLEEGDYFGALLAFNNCLCFCVEGSVIFAQGYGGRATVYFQLKLFDLSLQNIRLARTAGFTDDIATRMEAKTMRQQFLSGNRETSPWNFFKLSYEGHEKVPFIARCLELKEDPNFGSLFVSNQDLDAGDFIAIVDGASKMMDPVARLHRCTWCLADVLLNMIPCSGCPMAMFCSQECKEIGEKDFHYEHCSRKQSSVLKSVSSASVPDFPDAPMIFIIKKIFSRIEKLFGIKKFAELVGAKPKNAVKAKPNFFTFDWTTLDPKLYEKFMFMIHHSNSEMQIGNEGYFSAATQMQIIESLMSRNINFPGEETKLQFNYLQDAYKPLFWNIVGAMMNPLLSFVTVNCKPNATFVPVNNKFVMMVLRPIKAGERIQVSNDTNSLDNGYPHRRIIHQKFGCCPCRFSNERNIEPKKVLIETKNSTAFSAAEASFHEHASQINAKPLKDPSADDIAWIEVLEFYANIIAKPASFYP